MAGAALLAALILAPVIGGGFGELTNSIIQLFVFVAIAAHALASARRSDGWARAPGLLPISIFLAAFLVSVAFTEAVYASLKQLLFVAACLGGYALGASLCRDQRMSAAFVWGMVLCALGICVWDIRGYAVATGGGAQFWSHILGTGEHLRTFGTFLNPDLFGGFLVLVLPVTLAVYLVTRRTVLAVASGIAFVLEALTLMLTGTKFGIVSAVIALLVFFTLAIVTRALRRSRFRRLLVIAVVALPLLTLFSRPVTTRIAAAEAGGTQVHSTVFRYLTWSSTISMIADHPWLGVGPGVFPIAYSRYTEAGYTQHAHQSYLQMAAESGVVALGAFVIALLAIAHGSLMGLLGRSQEPAEAAVKGRQEASDHGITWRDLVPFSGWRLVNCGIFAALVGCAVRNMADSDWYVIGIALPFWVLAGTLAAQTGTLRAVHLGGLGRAALAGLCAVMLVLSVSFGLGDLIAPADIPGRGLSAQEMAARYSLASALSPANPMYHRELARYISTTDYSEALRQLDLAIRLEPTHAENHFLRGVFALRLSDDPKTAVRSLRTALQFSPNSTHALLWLARAYQAEGNRPAQETTLRRLIDIEESNYETIKGAPEMVDTSYAHAHAYFGWKLLMETKFAAAATQFDDAIDRLERWRKQEVALQAQRMMGCLGPEEELESLDLLRTCYLGLAEACSKMGDPKRASRARRDADRVARAMDKITRD